MALKDNNVILGMHIKCVVLILLKSISTGVFLFLIFFEILLKTSKLDMNKRNKTFKKLPLILEIMDVAIWPH